MSKKKAIEDIILEAEADRRLMPNVPDPSCRRSNHDRRDNHDEDASRPQYATYAGQRFALKIDVRVELDSGVKLKAETKDVSQTGMMLQLPGDRRSVPFHIGQRLRLTFRLHEGDLQEGTEKRYKRVRAEVVRVSDDGQTLAVHFSRPLYDERKATDRLLFMLATL